MLFVTTASQHFLSAAIDSLSNPTPPICKNRLIPMMTHHFIRCWYQRSQNTQYQTFKQITFDIFKQKGIVWAGLSCLLWQADRDARAVEASTRRMEVLKPGAEFLPRRRASKGSLVAGGHWWQKRIGSPHCCCMVNRLTFHLTMEMIARISGF